MKPYPPEAIEDAQRLYLRFNGQNHKLIEAEMQKKWPGWSVQNLYTRGKDANLKLGWIEKYGWEEALRLHLAARPEAVLNSAEELVREIRQIRRRIKADIDKLGAKVERDLIYQHRDYCKLELEALTKLETARDSLGGFVAMWERLLEWLPEIGGEQALIELLKVADQVIERATAEYGDLEQSAADTGSQG